MGAKSKKQKVDIAKNVIAFVLVIIKDKASVKLVKTLKLLVINTNNIKTYENSRSVAKVRPDHIDSCKNFKFALDF